MIWMLVERQRRGIRHFYSEAAMYKAIRCVLAWFISRPPMHGLLGVLPSAIRCQSPQDWRKLRGSAGTESPCQITPTYDSPPPQHLDP
nr:hypothetical protein CFP56_74959 [Quercus suber]